MSSNIAFCLIEASSVVRPDTGCDSPVADLTPGATVDAPGSSRLLNIRAKITDLSVGSVFMELSGDKTVSRTENIVPYDQFGDRGGETFSPGSYTVKATVYSGHARGGDVLATSTVSFTISEEAPGPPLDLLAVPGPAQVNLGWDAPDTSVTVGHYEVRWAPAGGAFSAWVRKDIADSETEPFRYLVEDLTDGTSYSFEVRAVATGDGLDTPGDSAATSGTPRAIGPPRGLEATAGHEKVVLGWSRPSTTLKVQYYQIRWAPVGDPYGSWHRHDVSSRNTSFEYEVDGLTNAQEYSFEVRAYAARGDGRQILVEGFSSAASVEATPVADPNVSSNVAFCLIEASSVVRPDTGCDSPVADLTAGAAVDAPESSRLLNIRARITGLTVGSVFMELSGDKTVSRTENIVPYDQFGDRGGETFSPGSYTIKATVYSGSARSGDVLATSTVSFTIRQHTKRLWVNNNYAYEGDEDTLLFKVILSPRSAEQTVTVDWTTRDGTATAGSDYEAASGTLTYAPGEQQKKIWIGILDDDHDEGNETFELVLSNATNARITDAVGRGTIRNSDAVPKALLARFGRAAAYHVVEHVDRRLEAARAGGAEGSQGVGVRFAGRDVRFGDLGGTAVDQFRSAVPGAPLHPAGSGGLAGISSVSGAGRPGVLDGSALAPQGAVGTGVWPDSPASGYGLSDMGSLAGSELVVSRPTVGGGVLSFSSRSGHSSFAGREGILALDGRVSTHLLGADYARGPVVVGLSFGRTTGVGGYDGASAGRVQSSVTGVYPWVGYRLSERVSVWGVTGYGAGVLQVSPGGSAPLDADLSMAMVAAGARGRLAGSDRSFALAFKVDALWVGTAQDAVRGDAGRLAASRAAVTRLRTGLEASRPFTFAGRVSLTPSVEIGVRQDGGDAENGAGVDAGGGLVFSDRTTGLIADVRVRMLVVHEAAGYRDSGFSVSLSYNPTPSTPLGLMARVSPSWGGQAVGGAEALWGRETMAGLGHGGASGGERVDAELGYGLPVGARFVGTPRVGFAASEYGRDYRLGYGFGLLDRRDLQLELGVDAQRRESSFRNGADRQLLGRAALRW